MKDWAAVQAFKSGVFPDVLAINSTGAATQDGTEYIAEQINNGMFGPTQAMMDYAAGGTNPDVGTVGVPNGVTEAAGFSQLIEAMHKGFGIGPGVYKPYGKFLDPSVTGDRILLLSGQGVLIASFPELVAATYVGDGNNPTAPFFYKSVLADGLTRDTAGPFFILPESRDYLFPNGPRITKAFWHTVNGYGSTNNKIQKFTTNVDVSDDVVVTIVNSATLGFSITANMKCRIYVTYSPLTDGTTFSGISKNSAQLTTGISSITTADRMTVSFQTGAVADEVDSISWSDIINNTDVIRPHTDGGASGSTPALGSITVLAIEAPRENSATVQGITY